MNLAVFLVFIKYELLKMYLEIKREYGESRQFILFGLYNMYIVCIYNLLSLELL